MPNVKPSMDPRRIALAKSLRPLAGRWVAIKDLALLHDDESARAVVDWLEASDLKADSVFRVPRDETEAMGMTPF